jgi:hypothetical protein
MFSSNGATEPPNGVVRIGDTIPEPRTIVVGTREYTGYVWGRRMPRTNEAMVRQAAQDLEIERARQGEPSHLFLLVRFLDDVRQAQAALTAGGSPDQFAAAVAAALEHYDTLVQQPQVPLPIWQTYLNRVMCGLIEGLSPIQADLFNSPETSAILEALHYPGFWKDPSLPNPPTPPAAASETTPPTTTSPTGSISKPESPPSVESESPSSAP